MNIEKEELEKLKLAQQNKMLVVEELGKISIAELELKDRKKRAEKFLFQLKEQEISLAKNLELKYGKGTVDFASGKFTPVK